MGFMKNVHLYTERKQIAGKLYNFKPCRQWPEDARNMINLSDFGWPHSMPFIGGVRGPRGSVMRVFTVCRHSLEAVHY